MPDIKALLRQAAKPTLFLLTFIFICAFLAHYLTGDETLLEYARNNPEQAYGAQSDPADEPVENDTTASVDSSLSDTTSVSPTNKTAETSDAAESGTPVTLSEPDAYTDSKYSIATRLTIT